MVYTALSLRKLADLRSGRPAGRWLEQYRKRIPDTESDRIIPPRTRAADVEFVRV